MPRSFRLLVSVICNPQSKNLDTHSPCPWPDHARHHMNNVAARWAKPPAPAAAPRPLPIPSGRASKRARRENGS